MSSAAYRFNDADNAVQVLDDEVMVLNLASGTYYALGGSAVQLWDPIVDSQPLSAIAEAVARLHGVATETVTADLEAFAARLGEENILQPSDATSQALVLAWGNDGYRAPTFEKHSDLEDLLTLDPIHDVDPQKGWPHY